MLSGNAGTEELARRIERIATRGGAELANCAVGVVCEGRVACKFAWGSVRPGATRRFRRPFRTDSLIRVASLSKPFVALAVLNLCERGLLDLDTDVSKLLAFRLRHPRHPDVAITPRMLLSHTSSLRDGERYSLPPHQSLSEFFDPDSEYWDDGAHFATPGAVGSAAADVDRPGAYFSYCNLGYGVLGTIIERTSGVRFDRFVSETVLVPMGLSGGFGLDALSHDALARLVPPYRKTRNDRYDARGRWVAQVDGRRRGRQLDASGSTAGYETGTNATFMSPQGGLRASLDDLLALVLSMVDPRVRAASSVVTEPSLAEMMRAHWIYDPEHPNGETYDGLSRLAGLGLFRTTATADAAGSDLLLPGGGPRLWGHHGDAYGFLGGVLFDPEAGYGFCFMIGGTAADPQTTRGRFSSYSWWEEAIQEAVLTVYPPPRSGTG